MFTNLNISIDKHKGKTGIVFAHGPSGKEFIQQLVKYSKDKERYCFIGLGELDSVQTNLNVDIDNDYWVMANTEMTVGNSYNRFNKFPKTTLIWADTADRTPYSIAWSSLKIPSISYDQRHFGNKPCQNCKIPLMSNLGMMWVPVECRVLPGRLTIQEELQKYTNYSTHYGTGSTVALHAAALAILLGCNPIHIYGVDLNCRLGYVDEKTQARADNVFDGDLHYIINDFDIISKSAHNIGVKLINYSKFSPLKDIMETI
jgi:hypothetical protein